MGWLDENDVHQTIQSLYQATLDETLLPELVARLKNAPPYNGPTATLNAPCDWLPGDADAPPTAARILSDSVSQSAYNAGHPSLLAALPGPAASPPIVNKDAITAHEARVNAVRGRAENEQSLNHLVLNHIHTALEITKKLERLKTREMPLQASLDRLAIGMILIDADKQVAGTNDRARATLAQGDLELRGQRLTTADKRARHQLVKRFSSAWSGRTRVKPWAAASPSAGSTVTPCRYGARPWMVLPPCCPTNAQRAQSCSFSIQTAPRRCRTPC